MGVIVDTGVFVHWERRGGFIDQRLSQLDSLAFISVVTASELLVGVHRANTPIRRETRSRFVEAILSQFPILQINLAAARHHAALSANLSLK